MLQLVKNEWNYIYNTKQRYTYFEKNNHIVTFYKMKSFLLAFGSQKKKKKNSLLAFTPNVKVIGSNMVSRNLENGSKNMGKKNTQAHGIKEKKIWKSNSNYEREIHIKGTLTP